MNILLQLATSDSFFYYTSDPGASASESSIFAAYIIVMMMFLVLPIIICSYVFCSYFMSRIFKKAGIKRWIAWVPFYNNWKMLEIGGQNGIWAVLAIVPIVNIAAMVFMYIAMYHIGRKLGKEDWFVLLAIFVPVVWLVWLGIDSSKWKENRD